MAIQIARKNFGRFNCFLGGMLLNGWGAYWWIGLIGVGFAVFGFFIAITDTHIIDDSYGSEIGRQIRIKKIAECVFTLVLGLVFVWFIDS